MKDVMDVMFGSLLIFGLVLVVGCGMVYLVAPSAVIGKCMAIGGIADCIGIVYVNVRANDEEDK